MDTCRRTEALAAPAELEATQRYTPLSLGKVAEIWRVPFVSIVMRLMEGAVEVRTERSGRTQESKGVGTPSAWQSKCTSPP